MYTESRHLVRSDMRLPKADKRSPRSCFALRFALSRLCPPRRSTAARSFQSPVRESRVEPCWMLELTAAKRHRVSFLGESMSVHCSADSQIGRASSRINTSRVLCAKKILHSSIALFIICMLADLLTQYFTGEGGRVMLILLGRGWPQNPFATFQR